MPLIRLLTDFDGRIGLRSFWLGSVLIALTLYGVQWAAPRLSYEHAAQIVAFANAFALFPWAALAAKRAVDRGSVPLFGILLVCAIVLPGQIRPMLSSAWAPSLDTIPLLAWIVALVDLGMLPGKRPAQEAVADAPAGAKAAG